MSALPINTNISPTVTVVYPLWETTVNVKNIRGWDATFSTIYASTFAAGDFSVSTASISSLIANSATISSLNAIYANLSTINSRNILTSTISSAVVNIDGNVLNTNRPTTSSLLLNGVPIATTADVASTVKDWAFYPATSTVRLANNNLTGGAAASFTTLAATTSLTTPALNGVITGSIKSLNSSNIINSNSITTATLESTGDVLVGGYLTANGGISTSAISTSAISTQSLAVSGNATFAAAPTFQNGANFNGARPNFNTGINTSGANNFNNTTLDNVGTIGADAVNVVGNFGIGLLADGGGVITTNNAIVLTTQNGGSSVITIQAKRNALLAYPVPLSKVDIIAEGNCPNIPIVPLTPYGGAINITACNAPDPIFPLTPITNAFAPGAIHLTAYSKGFFPGLITEAAGSILAYSGLTSPTVGVYGCSFYSALTCLSLTAGITPATTSFPGTVYLRGDSGTKVLNGLYIDHLYPAAGYTLAISGANGCNVTLNDVSYIGMSSNPVIDGGNVNGQIRNFSSITAGTIQANTLNINTISTGSFTLPQLYTSFINIAPPSTVYTTHPDLTINANTVVDEFGDPLLNNLNLLAGSNINIQCGGNPSFNRVAITGNVTVSRSVTASSNVNASGLSTINIQLSTINGVAYPIPDAFVSTATSALNMAGFDINTAGGNINLTNGNLNSVSLLSGNTSGFLNINAGSNIVIDNNQGARIELNTDGSIGLATTGANKNVSVNAGFMTFLGGNINTGSNFLDINGNGLGNFLSLKSGNTYYTIDTAGNPTVNALSTNQVIISQTAGSDFILFNNGDTRQNAVRDAYVGGNRLVFITAQQDAYLRAQSNVILETTTGYINLVAQGGSNGIYLTGSFTECRGYLTFNAVNNYINNLEHIYGDASAPGGGLAIDSMYGLFFNSSGKNANLYIDAGNLNMINYNSGINIANYNAYGTGNVSIFSQNNDVYIASANRSVYVNGTTGVSLACGGATISIAGDSNIYFTANGTAKYANFQETNVVFNTGTPGSLELNMNGNKITNLSSITSAGELSITATTNILTSAVSTINTVQNTYFSESVSRRLDGVGVLQPIIQYGEISTTGSSGNQTVTIPTRYGSATSYVAFGCMEDTNPAQIAITRDTRSQITIYWANGGGGSHTIVWQTVGT